VNRRVFIWSIACFFAFATLTLTSLNQNKKVRPPGITSEEEFFSLCIRCNRCADVCPTKGIKPDNSSLSSLGAPELDGYCAVYLDLVNPSPSRNRAFKKLRSSAQLCFQCIEACPTGALRNVGVEDLKMGVAKVDRSICLAWQYHICYRCVDICVFDAVEIKGSGGIEVKEEHCVGCKQCEYICPVPSKAIVVEPAQAEDLGEGRQLRNRGSGRYEH